MDYPPCIDPSCKAVPLLGHRRPTRSWIGTCLFRLITNGFAATVLHEGDAVRGTVLFLLAGADGTCRHYTQVRLKDGHVFWTKTGGRLDPVRSAELIEAAIRRDPDLWVCRIRGASFQSWSAQKTVSETRDMTFTPLSGRETGASVSARACST